MKTLVFDIVRREVYSVDADGVREPVDEEHPFVIEGVPVPAFPGHRRPASTPQ